MKSITLTPSSIDTEYYSTFLKISVPVALQSFISASLNLIDNIIVGQLGDAYIAGVGLANQFYFILNLILLGVSGGAAIFISQFWGNKNIANIKKVLGLSLILAVSSAAIFFLAAVLMPQKILSIFSTDAEVIRLGSSFLRIVSFSYILTAISTCYATTLRSTGNAALPMTASIIAIIINTALNYILIFGKLGFPSYGVAGSATATVIARIVELLILLIIVYVKKSIAAAKLKELFDIPSALFKRFMTTSGAVIFKDVIWALGTTAYMIIYARLGTEAIASINIVQTVRQLSFVLFTGIANACLIMVGNQIGANRQDTAFAYAKRFLKMTVFFGIAIGITVILSRNLLLSPYHVSNGTIKGAYNVLFVCGILLFFDVFNMVSVVGIMRSGGDINFCIVMDMIAVWAIGLPLAIIGGIILKLPVEWVFTLISLQELFKFVLCLKRFVSRKWINNLVHDLT